MDRHHELLSLALQMDCTMPAVYPPRAWEVLLQSRGAARPVGVVVS